MNTTVTALLFFSGMIAFVQNSQEPFKVDALLVTLAGHTQKLVLPLSSLEAENDCSEPCKVKKPVCECPLSGATVDFESVSGDKLLPNRPPSRLPRPNNYTKLGWMVSIWYIKPKASHIDKSSIQTEVGSKITFGWNDGATCRFEESPCGNDTRRIWGVDFETAIVNPIQAVAEEVVFESTISSPIAISKDGKVAHLRLKCPDSKSCPILISNIMKGGGDPKELCEECDSEGGDHFVGYGKVSAGTLDEFPRRLCGKYRDLVGAPEPDMCILPEKLRFMNGKRTVGDRIICPSAIFQP